MEKSSKKFLGKSSIYIVLVIALILFLFPVMYMFSVSFKPVAEMTNLFSSHFTLANYVKVWLHSSFPRYLLNSCIISFSSIVLLCLLGTMPSYLITRFAMRRTLFGILIFRAAPPVGFLLPFFIMYYWLGLMDTYISVISVVLVRLLPLFVWLMAGFFQNVPQELEEAAMVDGCSRTQALLKVILPLAAPGLIATMIICFILSWNDLLYALILTGVRTRTLPVAISGFVGYASTSWGLMAAASTVITFPVLLFGMMVQKYVVVGLAAGSLKE